jgi:hypothetical protein
MITRHAPRLALAVLLAAACLYTYRSESVADHSWPAAGITAVDIATGNGAVTVAPATDTFITAKVTRVAWGKDKAEADKALENVVFTDTVDGTRLRMKVEMPSGQRPYGANIDARVPSAVELNVQSTNGEISVAGITGAIAASTSNGAVNLTGTTGTASLSTTNGAVTVEVHSGPLYAGTTNGAVGCDIAALRATEDVGLATTNGRVTLLLPDDVSAIIDATTTNGLITIHDFTVVYQVQTRDHVRGQIGSGASTVTITTTNGEVTIRRRS